MTPVALIQLVSEQTLQNILPALALPPDQLGRVVLLHTPRTARQCEWIETALRLSGRHPQVRRIPLSDLPDIHETARLVGEHLEAATAQGVQPLLNFTGGTKPMSVGAYAAAIKRKAGSIYVDTEHRRFLDGRSGPIPATFHDGWATLSGLEHQLSVPLILAANGLRLTRPGRDFQPLVPLAEYLRSRPKEEETINRLASRFAQEMEKAPSRARVLESWTRQPFVLPSPQATDLAVTAGLLARREGTTFLPYPTEAELLEIDQTAASPDGVRRTAHQHLQESLNFFAGSWWEVCVADAMNRSGRFRDLRWSPEVAPARPSDDSAPEAESAPDEDAPEDSAEPPESGVMEEDILAVDSLQLAYVSCKRGGQGARLLRAFEEFDFSARRLGGSFTSRFLAIAKPIAKVHFAAVQERARATRAHLVGPADKLAPHRFQESRD